MTTRDSGSGDAGPVVEPEGAVPLPTPRAVDDGLVAGQFGIHRRVLSGAASNWTGQVVVLATGFVLTPFILHHIGATAYALWVLATSLTSYGSLLNLGITSAVVKYVAEHRARGAIDEVSRLASAAAVLYTFLALVAIAIAAAVAPFVPGLFNIAPDQRGLAVWLTLLIGLQVAVSLPTSVPGAVLRGFQRFDLSNAIVIAGTLVTAAATVAVLILGGGVVALVAVSTAITVVMQIPTVWLVRHVAPELRFRPRVDLRQIRGIFGFSASVFGVRIAAVLNSRTDAIVIGSALPIGVVTPYALAQRLSEVVSLLTNQFTQVILPVASELDARSDSRALRAVYLSATRMSIAIALPLAATLWVLGGEILSAWVGSEYARYDYLVRLLALAAFVDIVAWAGGFVLTGMARHRPLAWMALAASGLNVLMSVVLVVPLGVEGVAVATLVASVVQTTLLVLPYTMRVIKVRPLEIVRHAIVPNLLPAVIVTALLVLVQQTEWVTSLATLAVAGGLGCVAYVVAYLRFGASSTERAFYRHLQTSAVHIGRRKQ